MASLSLLSGGGALRVRNAHVSPRASHPNKPAPPSFSPSGASRRDLLFSLTAATVMTGLQPASMAEDIPLFGIRKKLKKAEEEAVEIVKEGFETAEKGVVAAERGLEAAEKGLKAAEIGVETAEKEIETAVSYNGVTQAGAVVAAEFVGVLVATSVVNGILGPEAQKS
uniref:Synechocystis YCF37 n=1 Tax=Noccaea caerulescens TaxID=107243 RepID=A0A1J3K508_NOCCA